MPPVDALKQGDRGESVVYPGQLPRELLDTMPNPNSRTEIGARLVLTRKALDYTQATMAGLMGIDGQTLAAYEAGRRRIPMKHALKLCPYGIPLDWIYQGQVANLHPHIRDKILELASHEERGGH